MDSSSIKEPIVEVSVSASNTVGIKKSRQAMSQVNHQHYTAQKLKQLNWLKKDKDKIEVYLKNELIHKQSSRLKTK